MPKSNLKEIILLYIMPSTNSITQPSDNNSGNQTENPILRRPDSVLPLASRHQYPERTSDIEKGSAELVLLALNTTRSEEPNTTTENSDQQISHANAIQLGNSQVNPLEHHISEREEVDRKTTTTTVAGVAIGVSVAGVFGIGQLFRGKQVTHRSPLCLLTASLLLMFTSFITGMFLFVFSRTQRSFQNMSRIIQFLLWSAAISTTLGVLMVALYIGLEGL
ncbi:uncharacterized protein LOC122092772 isoform X2 [Macadamia integrifolia]|uniref:uncharacterized protein LOC122092772 isoform X2 n=2 Tax=Macadamia integrifolia TaxID=60698 RepID=UPI001C53185B|nr:uncharacterized protein LOC122092772 isoform X2 [Macadamia integrifolia]